jgi:hypothetical protein
MYKMKYMKDKLRDIEEKVKAYNKTLIGISEEAMFGDTKAESYLELIQNMKVQFPEAQ